MAVSDKAERLLCYLGHAGFALGNDSTCLLMDPWLSGKGAFLHTWFPFPDNSGLAEQLIACIGGRHLYVYISHVHEDHCDIEFLQQLEELHPTFVLPGFQDDSLRRRMQRISGKKVFVSNGGILELDQHFTVRLFLEESGINTDSAIWVSCDGWTVFNLNDCKIYDRLATIGTGAIDVLTCQFSGATWHPLCYDYERPTYESISLKRKNAKFYQVEKVIRAVDPKLFIPSAGPAVLLHPALYERNFEPINIFPKAEEFVSHLSRRSLSCELRILRPGQAIVLGTSEVRHVLEERGAPDLESYRLGKQSLYRAAPRASPEVLLIGLLDEVRAKLTCFQTRLTTRFTILFGVNGTPERILVNLNMREAKLVTEYVPTGPLYTITAAPEAVEALLAHDIEWENFCLSFLFRIRRQPDEYCPLVNMFFFCSQSNLAAALHWLEEFRSSDARIEIETPQGRFTCRRYCPHQGAEVIYGYAQDGFWVCPRHRWRFDLARGGLSEDGSCSIEAVSVSTQQETRGSSNDHARL